MSGGTMIRVRLLATGPLSVAGAHTANNTNVYTISGPYIKVTRVQFLSNVNVIGDFADNPGYDAISGGYALHNAALDRGGFVRDLGAAQAGGTLAISMSWTAEFLQFYQKILEQMSFSADATHNFADPANPAAILNTFTRRATALAPTDTEWQIDLLTARMTYASIPVAWVNHNATAAQYVLISLRLDLTASGLTGAEQLTAMQQLIAADWRALLEVAPASTSTAPLTKDVRRWQKNIRQHMLHYVPLTRGQQLMDAAADAAENALGGALSNAALNDTERQQRVAQTARNEIDRFLITANPWGQATNTGDYPEAIHTVLALNYYAHFAAMPVAVIRSFPTTPPPPVLTRAQENQLLAQVGMGNCAEHGQVAFSVLSALMRRNAAAKTLLRHVVSSGYANVDHCFVAGGEPPHEIISAKIHVDGHPSHDPKNTRRMIWDANRALENSPKTAGREGWICDPYLAAGQIASTLTELCNAPQWKRLAEWLLYYDMYPPPATPYVARADTDTVADVSHIHVICFCTEAGTVTGIAPSHGPAAGGTDVTVTGTHLELRARLKIDDIDTTAHVITLGRELKAKTGVHAAGGPLGIEVRNWKTPAGLAGSVEDIPLATCYTYDSAPGITILDVVQGPTTGGTDVTITGTDFLDGAQVFYDGVAATRVTFAATTSLQTTTPFHVAAVAVPVRVRNPDGQEVVRDNAFTYLSAPAPTITSVLPNSGSSLGGTDVTITGQNFVAGVKVTFGGAPATVADVQPLTLTVRTTALAAALVAVVVENVDTKSVSSGGAFTYVAAAPPAVAAIDPVHGPSLGATEITITGTSFAPGVATTRVFVGGVEATNVRVDNATTIRAITAAHAAGAVAVEVRNPDTQSGSQDAFYTYDAAAAPTVASALPADGPVSGGTKVTITGTGFVAPVRVFFGVDEAAEVRFVSDTSVEARPVPAAAGGPVAVEVRNPDDQRGTRADTFTFNAAPTFTSVLANNGPAVGGTSVVITGGRFVDLPRVFFDTNEARVTFDSATQLTVITPGHAAGPVPLEIRNPDDQRVVSGGAFTYAALPAPTITGLDVPDGPQWGNTLVTITGTNYTPNTPGTAVLVDGAAAADVRVVSTTSITFRTPPHAVGAAVAVSVKNPDGQQVDAAGAFTFAVQPAPVVLSVNPITGPAAGGTPVTVTGTGFAVGMRVQVWFGLFVASGAPALNVRVTSPNTLTLTTPPFDGLRRINVRNPDGQTGNLPTAFTFT